MLCNCYGYKKQKKGAKLELKYMGNDSNLVIRSPKFVSRSVITSNVRNIDSSREVKRVVRKESCLLFKEDLDKVFSKVPIRFLNSGEWRKIFTTSRDGCSMSTFFVKCIKYPTTILIIKTNNQHVLGCFCTEKWKMTKEKRFYGNGENFVFSFRRRKKGKIYKWNKKKSPNKCFQMSYNSIGIGGPNFAIYIDSKFDSGVTKYCETFNNPPLVDCEDFEIAELEVWGFVPKESE